MSTPESKICARDYVTLSYGAGGGLQWVRHYNGPEESDDGLYRDSIALDDAGNIHSAGESSPGSADDCQSRDFATVKYGRGGSALWIQRRSHGSAPGVAVVPAGDVFVAGVGPRSNLVVVKYEPDGAVLWEREVDGPRITSVGWGVEFIPDPTGNIYVGVYFTFPEGGFGPRAATIYKLDGEGDLLWVRRYSGPEAESFGLLHDLEVDVAGDVYATGRIDIGGIVHYGTLKYGRDGDLVWVALYDTGRASEGGLEGGLALALDRAGGVYVTGRAAGDYLTIKYRQAEIPQPAARFVRGDADASGEVNLSDPVSTLNYLFLGSDAPPCLKAADADDEGTINVTDPVHTLHFLFRGGAPPPSPYPDCGEDPTADELDCGRGCGGAQ